MAATAEAASSREQGRAAVVVQAGTVRISVKIKSPKKMWRNLALPVASRYHLPFLSLCNFIATSSTSTSQALQHTILAAPSPLTAFSSYIFNSDLYHIRLLYTSMPWSSGAMALEETDHLPSGWGCRAFQIRFPSRPAGQRGKGFRLWPTPITTTTVHVVCDAHAS